MTLEEKYENYLLLEDKIKIINCSSYYRIVDKDYINVNDGIVLITIPAEATLNKTDGLFEDENGRKFFIKGPEMPRFSGEIPNLYMKILIFIVVDIKSINDIGNYIRSK